MQLKAYSTASLKIIFCCTDQRVAVDRYFDLIWFDIGRKKISDINLIAVKERTKFPQVYQLNLKSSTFLIC